jgi:hypothetical protein
MCPLFSTICPTHDVGQLPPQQDCCNWTVIRWIGETEGLMAVIYIFFLVKGVCWLVKSITDLDVIDSWYIYVCSVLIEPKKKNILYIIVQQQSFCRLLMDRSQFTIPKLFKEEPEKTKCPDTLSLSLSSWGSSELANLLELWPVPSVTSRSWPNSILTAEEAGSWS